MTPPTATAAPPKRAARTTTFGVQTRIAKAAGKDGRYSCGAIHALPVPVPGAGAGAGGGGDRDQVVLEATDGHQATCILAPGEMHDARLVPAGVLPTRQLGQPAAVRLVDNQWQSTEGKLADDQYGTDGGSFPPLADILPAVHKTPFFETPRHAESRRRKPNEPESMHITVGVDIDTLRKVADGLGTVKLTLMVPVPIRHPKVKPSEVCVNRPVIICPSNGEGARGIGVLMPHTPGPGSGPQYYEKVRDIVRRAEAQARDAERKRQN